MAGCCEHAALLEKCRGLQARLRQLNRPTTEASTQTSAASYGADQSHAVEKTVAAEEAVVTRDERCDVFFTRLNARSTGDTVADTFGTRPLFPIEFQRVLFCSAGTRLIRSLTTPRF